MKDTYTDKTGKVWQKTNPELRRAIVAILSAYTHDLHNIYTQNGDGKGMDYYVGQLQRLHKELHATDGSDCWCNYKIIKVPAEHKTK